MQLCLLFPDNPLFVITVLFFYIFKILENKNCNRSDKTFVRDGRKGCQRVHQLVLQPRNLRPLLMYDIF